MQKSEVTLNDFKNEKMKRILLLFVVVLVGFQIGMAQDSTAVAVGKYRLLKTDGKEIVVQILSQNERELYVILEDGRRIYIPQYVIEKIEKVDLTQFNEKGEYIGEDNFATRYFITTNGLPIKKGEHYVQWNLFGPDFQFGLGKNTGIGVMTSWLGIPIIGTLKKSFTLGEKAHLGLGMLAGTGSWASISSGGVLGFATLSFGDRSQNIAISGGYAALWFDGDNQNRPLTSVAGVIKVNEKISLVFDSFVLMPAKSTFSTYTSYDWNGVPYQQVVENKRPLIALMIPGVRWHQSSGKAFQFGFAGLIEDDEVLPVPIPMIQWYRRL